MKLITKRQYLKNNFLSIKKAIHENKHPFRYLDEKQINKLLSLSDDDFSYGAINEIIKNKQFFNDDFTCDECGKQCESLAAMENTIEHYCRNESESEIFSFAICKECAYELLDVFKNDQH